ncbi:MAG TPA: hypothetical protein VFZ77_02345 [Acidimicrobiales bacterium]
MTEAVVLAMLCAVAVAVLLRYDWSGSRRRRVGVADWAAQRGWRYVARDQRWEGLLPGFPFDRGIFPRAQNVVTGAFGGYAAGAFDFSYRSDKRNDFLIAQRFGVHVLRLPAALPWVHLSPETLADRAAKLLGAQDIDFESEEFNRVYRVQASDPRFASDLVNPRTMDLLMQRGAPDLRVHGRHIVVVTAGPLHVALIDTALALLAGVCENLPSFVWSERGVAPPPPLANEARS